MWYLIYSGAQKKELEQQKMPCAKKDKGKKNIKALYFW